MYNQQTECVESKDDEIVTNNNVKHNTLVLYTCKNGYKPEGINIRTCSNGEYVPSFEESHFECKLGSIYTLIN